MSSTRRTLRESLLARREAFVAGPGFDAAAAHLARHLGDVLGQLEPGLLGLYWPQRSEFNAAHAVLADPSMPKLAICLPFAERTPPRLHYRAWDGAAPSAADEFGIPTSHGAAVRPDVVLVPCVGFTPAGYRLGYGGGFFDRWLAQHPDVTAIGVAWQVGAMQDPDFRPEPHDIPLALVVTEHGVA